METLQNAIHHLTANEQERHSRIRSLAEMILKLVSAEGDQPASFGDKLIDAIVAVLRHKGEPMRPRDIRDELLKVPPFNDTDPAKLRDLIDRAIWAELKRTDKRIARTGDGLYTVRE